MKPQQGKTAWVNHMMKENIIPKIMWQGKPIQERIDEKRIERELFQKDVGILGQSAHTIIMDEGDEIR